MVVNGDHERIHATASKHDGRTGPIEHTGADATVDGTFAAVDTRPHDPGHAP